MADPFTNTARRAVNDLLNEIDLPHTNQPVEQKYLYDYHVSSVIIKTAETYKKAALDAITNRYNGEIASLPTNEQTKIADVHPFVCLAKLSNPRETFDKDAFIDAVAREYDINKADLVRLASTCTKKSKAPLTITVALDKD